MSALVTRIAGRTAVGQPFVAAAGLPAGLGRSPMPGSFGRFNERADLVEVHTGQRFETEGRELDSLARCDRSFERQPIAEYLAHGFLERLSGFPHAAIELCPEMVVDGYRDSHTMMLAHRAS